MSTVTDPLTKAQRARVLAWLRARAPAWAKRGAATFALWGRRYRDAKRSPTKADCAAALNTLVAAVAGGAMGGSYGGFDIAIKVHGKQIEAHISITDSEHADLTEPAPLRCTGCGQDVPGKDEA